MGKHTTADVMAGPWIIGEKFPNNGLFPKCKNVTPIRWPAPPCGECGKGDGEYLVAHVYDGACPGQKGDGSHLGEGVPGCSGVASVRSRLRRRHQRPRFPRAEAAGG